MSGEQKTVAKNAILLDLLSKMDVDAVGIASLAEWKGTKLEETALRLLPQVRSVIVLAMEIYPEILDLLKLHHFLFILSKLASNLLVFLYNTLNFTFHSLVNFLMLNT